jgi:hypothetical protein
MTGTTSLRSSALKNRVRHGSRVDISRGFFRVFGLTKITLLLAFTIVGYNLDRIRSFLAKTASLATRATPARAARRRRGTWDDVLGKRAEQSGRDPPRA